MSEWAMRRETLGLSCKGRVALFAILLMSGPAFGQSPTENFQLAGVKVQGLVRFKEAQAVAASGLRIGQTVNLRQIQAAVEKLGRSGYLENIKYQYSYLAGKMDVEFQVVEARRFLPCLFDNFVWLGDNEILDAIRARVPLFDGSLPDGGTALQDAAQALVDFLRTRKIPATVTTMLNQGQPGAPMQHLFRASGMDLPIRSLAFPGAKAVSEQELQESAKSLLGQQYSRTYASQFARRTLAQLFRKKGYLRIQFKDPAVRIESGSPSEYFVNLTLEPEEGLSYTWNGADWTCDCGYTPEELDRLLRIRKGDVADGLLIDAGLASVKDALGKKGYIEAQPRATPAYDDSNRSVIFRIEVAAGPQYRMGIITFKGVDDETARRLESLWRLRPGDVFDTSYIGEFMKTDARAEIARIRPKQTGSTVRADRARLTVNLTIEFK